MTAEITVRTKHQLNSLANNSPTHYLCVRGHQVAYRAFGAGKGIPFLFCTRFRGTMDHWDPALIDLIAAERTVLLFDSLGVGRTSGTAPDTIRAMADFAAAFIAALGIPRVDVLGWSMGGSVAQMLTLEYPHLVRRLVLAGASPGNVPQWPQTVPSVWETALKPVHDDADVLYLFFPDTPAGLRAGNAHLARLGQHVEALGPPVKSRSVATQAAALRAWYAGVDVAYNRLDEIQQRTLVANGQHDIMVHAYNSYSMGQRIPCAELVLYPDAGHGFLFQESSAFGKKVLKFLNC
jgi:pimeloyl-ACP methyl ester carboxylesterase